MNSPSEACESAGVASAALLGGKMRRREVMRLEFHSPGQRGEDASGVEKIATDVELRLREEIGDLTARMQRQAEAAAIEIEEARRDARVGARAEWELELREYIDGERAAVARACEAFRVERARYFSGVEAEVVKLALGIASRILHREVKMDALLLSAAVRVALEKVAEGSEVVLRVPVEDVEAWRRVVDVELVGDGGLVAGECVLETKVGRVELGVNAQLEEIERGFFDLMQQRPV